MCRLLRCLIALVCLTVSVAWAASCTEYQATNNGNGIGTWYTSKSAACAGLAAIRNAGNGPGAPTVVVNGTEPMCRMIQGTFQYSDGYNERLNPDCADNCAAQAGQANVVNWTVGYARTANEGDYNTVGPVTQLPASGKMCIRGCEINVGSPVAAWRSLTPTEQGLHRLSIDVNTTAGSASCSEADPVSANPASSPPPCAGSLGTVNGKPYCAGTAANPVAGDAPSNLPVPPANGNPAAGTKPATGEGSGSDGAGRTPASGDGGPSGGPGGAAGGTGTGTTGPVTGGTVTKPGDGKEQANCGAPGQPQCKIDESGTPTDASGKFNDANNKLGAAMDSIKGSIEGVKDIAAPTWTWSFQLPTGCTPFPMWDGVTIDMCQYQTTIHDLMSMIWLLTTAWACIAIVGRTVGQGG